MKIYFDNIIYHLQSNHAGGLSRMWQAWMQSLPEAEVFDRVKWGLPIRQFDTKNKILADAEKLTKELEPDSLFISSYYTFPAIGKSIQCIPDLIPEIMQYDLDKWIHKVMSIQNAAAIIAISNNTKNDIIKRYHFPEDKIHVVPLFVDDYFYPATNDEISQFKEKYHLPELFFLQVGNRFYHKNTALILKTFNCKEMENIPLVMAGWGKVQKREKVHCQNTIINLGYLSNSDLRLAYSSAQGLIYPSLYEGFGMPVVEAQACGCPVITTSRGSLLEVADGSAITISPFSQAELLAGITQILNDSTYKHELIMRGFSNSQRFSKELSISNFHTAVQRIITH